MLKYTVNCFLIITIILISSCSTNKYISHEELSSSIEGDWYLNKSKNKKLHLSKIEDDIYNVKFTSVSNNWEGIGYKIGDELLTIFKYHNLDNKGYVTFNFSDKNKVYYKSINTSGEFRSSGNYYRIESP